MLLELIISQPITPISSLTVHRRRSILSRYNVKNPTLLRHLGCVSFRQWPRWPVRTNVKVLIVSPGPPVTILFPQLGRARPIGVGFIRRKVGKVQNKMPVRWLRCFPAKRRRGGGGRGGGGSGLRWVCIPRSIKVREGGGRGTWHWKKSA